MKFTAVIATSVLAATPALAQTPSFTLIDPDPGQTMSQLFALSADGSAAAGSSASASLTAVPGFRWTAAGGRFDFGLQPGLPAYTAPGAISGDGQYVVGSSFQDINTSVRHAYRWSTSSGYEDLGTLGGYQSIDVTGASSDGSAFAGHLHNGGGSTPPTGVAYRWTASGGFQPLPYLRSGSDYAEATGISRDGNVVVGTSENYLAGVFDAFRWTPQGGIQALTPMVNPPLTNAFANGVSGNGQVIVGGGSASGGGHPWRWTQATGMLDMGLPTGATSAVATLANFDGSLIVGTFNIGGTQGIPYVWTADSGFVRWTDYITGLGVTLPMGFSSYTVSSVSDDGTVFGGYARTATTSRAFVVTVPAPGATGAVLIGLAFLKRRPR